MTETEFSRLLVDAFRYRWLRKEYAAGRETDLQKDCRLKKISITI